MCDAGSLSTNACGSIGLKSPERSRSADSTWVMPLAAWAPPANVGIAIGSGSILPRVMSRWSSARADSGITQSTANTNTVSSRSRRFMKGPWNEGYGEGLPLVIFLWRKFERLAARIEQGAARAFGSSLEELIAQPLRIHQRRGPHGAVRIHRYAKLRRQILSVSRAGGHVPALFDLLLDEIELAYRELRA